MRTTGGQSLDRSLSADEAMDTQAYHDFVSEGGGVGNPLMAAVAQPTSDLVMTSIVPSSSQQEQTVPPIFTSPSLLQQSRFGSSTTPASALQDSSRPSTTTHRGGAAGAVAAATTAAAATTTAGGGGTTGSVSGSGSGSGQGSGVSSSFAPATAGLSQFGTYADSIANRHASSFAMMDLEESLRALYFAPVPLIVLDQNRNIKLLNRPAEIVLKVDVSSCAGQRLERFVAPASRQAYSLALNEASSKLSSFTAATAIPVATRLQMQSATAQPGVWTDLTISAWHPTDTIFNASDSDRSSLRRDSTDTMASPYSAHPSDSSTRSSFPQAAFARAPHEDMYTISLMPSRAEASQEAALPSDGTAVAFKDSIFQHLDTAIFAMSKDSKLVFRNRACNEIFSGIQRMIEPKDGRMPIVEGKSGEQKAAEEGDIDFTFINEHMDCYDEHFRNPFPQTEWPLLKAAVLGQSAPPVLVGMEAKATKERVLVEVAGKPIRENNGYGQHIGGYITLKDASSERSKIKAEAEMQGDVYFKQTCDSMPQLVWVASATGYVEWYSQSWFEYTGASLPELLGGGWTTFIHEEDMPETSIRWTHALRTASQYEVAYRCKRHDGAWRWFLGRALPLKEPGTGVTKNWFGTCTDIHDQVEALSASRRTQNQLKSVINHAAMTLWAVDREGKITVAEGPGVRQLKLVQPSTPGSDREMLAGGMQGMLEQETLSERQSNRSSGQGSRRSVVGRSIYQVWDMTNIRDSMERALSGESVVEEMEIDGRWFRTSYTPLREQTVDFMRPFLDGDEEGGGVGGEEDVDVDVSSGEIIGVVGASMDITDRKQAQEQMEESLLEKTRALAAEGAAREASRLKSEFLANMSHEIRTPIAGIIGLTELLLDETGLTQQQKDYAETIQRSAEGLLTVINDVLDFSKVEIGKLDVEQAPFNLEVLLRDAKRMLSFATQKKGLEFRDSMELTYKGHLIGDVGRLRQVITNLLTNAIKFTAQGYISLDVAELSEDTTRLLVRFDVRDTGCGIHPDALSRLFQPFSQADPSTARRFGGTGLGLSISKNLVELMNGEIGLNSVEGQGCHAWFIIPFRKAGATGVVTSSTTDASTSSSGLPINERTTLSRPRKDIWILIAEDNVVNARIASKNVERMGFSCRTAENGLLALEALKKDDYDAVLMDCQMPECDGYEATRMIRRSSNPDIRILPVIALTASAIKGDRERAIEAGMVDYLAKPVKRPALETTLCKWLFDQDARQTLAQFMYPEPSSPEVQRNNRLMAMPPPPHTTTIKWNENVQVGRRAGETASLSMQGALMQPGGVQRYGSIGGGGGGGGSGKGRVLSHQRSASRPDVSSSASSSPARRGGGGQMQAPLSPSSSYGSNLGAAAVLLSNRSSSADGNPISLPLSMARAVRPLLQRSQSHGPVSNPNSARSSPQTAHQPLPDVSSSQHSRSASAEGRPQ